MVTEDEKKKYVSLCMKKHKLYILMRDGVLDTPEKNVDFHRQIADIDNKIRHMFSYICADPEKIKYVVMWMVEVQGISFSDLSNEVIVGTLKKMNKLINDSQDQLIAEELANNAVDKIGGKLCANITAELEHNGFIVANRGVGTSGWHVASWCTTFDADRMIAYMRSKYKEEIDNYVIALRRLPCSFGFKDLHFQSDIIEYAQKHGIE